MGDALARYQRASKAGKDAKGRQDDRPRGDDMAPLEKRALKKMRAEAQEHGATLASGGKGGLPPSFVLGVMRRDKFTCTEEGKGCTGNQDLTVHHVGGIVDSPAAAKAGHRLTRDNVVTLCATCHDHMHEEARKEGEDASQVLPVGDVGDPKYDKHDGRPVSKG